MIIRTNAPRVLDTVLRILSDKRISCTKKNNNEAEVTVSTEEKIRLLLQEKLDENKFDFVNNFVRVDGNSVWSYDRIIKEIKAIKKKDSTIGVSNYLYSFMHHNFTDACCNAQGWSDKHPTWNSVLEVLKSSDSPAWKSDVRNIQGTAVNDQI